MAENTNRKTDPDGRIRTAMLSVMSTDDYAHVRLALLKSRWASEDQAALSTRLGDLESAATFSARAAHFGDIYERMA